MTFMIIPDHFRRAWKGFLVHELKYTTVASFVVVSIVSAAPMLLLAIIGDGPRTIATGNALVAAIGSLICAAALSSQKQLAQKFSFPMSRAVYSVGSASMIVLNTAVMMIAALLTTYILSIYISLFNPETIFIGTIFNVGITFSGNLLPAGTGLDLYRWFSNLVFVASLVYFLFTFYTRFKLLFIIALAVLIASVFNIAGLAAFLEQAAMFFFGEDSLILFNIKVWTAAAAIHLGAYALLKGKEIAR
ncbi:MAG TPA: hypothetical protein VLH18_06320 [Candidatus Limnocylindrales bacterium]|nr:hypothetical protein [Candidatus Limnocylindrales bacterium]